MKVYSKKMLFSGIVFLIMSMGSIGITLFVKFSIHHFIVAVIFAMISIFMMQDSLSKEAVLNAKVEEFDERNRLIELHAKSKSMSAVRVLCSLGIVAGTSIYFINQNAGCIVMAVTFLVLFIFSFLIEVICILYYHKKM